MKTNDEIKKMAREVVNQMHDAEITKPPHVVITYTELNDLVGQICQVKDAERDEAMEGERERIVKLLDWRNRTDGAKFYDGSDVVDWYDEKIATLTPNISNNK